MTITKNVNNETVRSGGLKVRSSVKAGGIGSNHNETVVSR